jgi:hypothetical protein
VVPLEPPGSEDSVQVLKNFLAHLLSFESPGN